MVSNVFAADLPNVVFILSDDQAWSDYGFITGNAPGAQDPDQCVLQKVMNSLGGEPVALRNRMR